MNFGDAIKELKLGKRLQRTGWNGKGLFIYLVPAASYPVETGAAKEHFGAGAMVPYAAYLALKNVDETVSTWAPSINDTLAEDWQVVGCTLPGHQQRVLDDKQELDIQITRQDEFILRNALFRELDPEEQARMRRQLDVMRELSVILGERISAF
ncbi:DUF2829 domain-containing protein [Comamonas thiooxydans]|uniref:DUF2829 domain-containing protein n=1 Tax=Comamonas thiooxydans TaxID=363952 RepID=A0AA42TWY0_9BURK|nr:DUF2829 domain-containing protein [Comamonas thiooxydans]MDH1336858.1 DUF2829 domain-containing protein [Comamonas thiooxydans]MDH1743777.1 DUF2829 domain-containing protein [Comamonas thiooxydans]MDH1789363.1 DUF2829 domain-containing protein [Comamonas thiooxydans]